MSKSMFEIYLGEESQQEIDNGRLFARAMRRKLQSKRWLPIALIAIAFLMLQTLPAHAQDLPSGECPATMMPGQTFFRVPEIIAQNNKLRGTILLSDQQDWMAFRRPISAPTDQSTSQCFPQYVRILRGMDTMLYQRNNQGSVSAVPYAPAPAANGYPLPMPGPTLRARVGDLVQLTFLNQINAQDFPNSIDRGETGQGGGCDSSTAGYPGGDKYPDCFHGSSTGNIHFHGTHTNPNSTGDNVFIEVRPAPRDNDKPTVTAESVQSSFNEFFANCETQLKGNQLRQWPLLWSDLPKAWTDKQQSLLKQYDKLLAKDYPNTAKQLWPVDAKQLLQGAWPQYYIGAYPYCFRLPEYNAKAWPPPSNMAPMHMGGAGTAEAQSGSAVMGDHNQTGAGMNMGMGAEDDAGRTLMMGQSPGTHWYHAHKHGSTAINVANGMTGAFIIEGPYDDDLNSWYGANWTRTQPVLVINQLGVTPNLSRGGGGQIDKGPDFSINGQLKPVIQMQPGEVQMWRIVNTSGRAGVFFNVPKGLQWRQLAQDGVQFNDANYQQKLNKTFLMAAGNRVDLLVKAPATPCTIVTGCLYPVIVQNEVDPSDLKSAAPLTLLNVSVTTGQPVDPKSHGANFIPNAPSFPPFLADIANDEVKGWKEIRFASTAPGTPPTPNAPPGGPPKNPAMHTINGKKFDGEVGALVQLNKVEEWKIINETYGPQIAHPFHIHINPFQIVEVFDPNATVPNPAKPGQTLPKYVFDGGTTKLQPGQCRLDPFAKNPNDWKPCDTPAEQKNLIWWDVFPIPSGQAVTTTKKDAKGNPIVVNVPGYFKMRSRFVDYTGYYVIHCHILAHEDRGMMTVVEVAPGRPPYSHN